MSFIGDPIPKDIAEQYSGKHWRKEIAIEIPEKYDGTSYYMCPNCNYTWGRWTGKSVDLKTGKRT